MIAYAANQNQKIYKLDLGKIDQLANITIDTEARNEIRNALYQGKEVTVHDKPITYFGWVGSGYIVEDPDTGAGAYKISGGANGGSKISDKAWYVTIQALVFDAIKKFKFKPVFYRLIKNAFFLAKGVLGYVESVGKILWNCDGYNLFMGLYMFATLTLLGIALGFAIATIPIVGIPLAVMFSALYGKFILDAIIYRCNQL